MEERSKLTFKLLADRQGSGGPFPAFPNESLRTKFDLSFQERSSITVDLARLHTGREVRSSTRSLFREWRHCRQSQVLSCPIDLFSVLFAWFVGEVQVAPSPSSRSEDEVLVAQRQSTLKETGLHCRRNTENHISCPSRSEQGCFFGDWCVTLDDFDDY